jgi:VIT1/CCC1 family predicted Fe2+/Mn2+ transporter
MKSHAEIDRKSSKVEEYLGEFVYGGIDGCVTTFAVVAGAVGASLESSIIIVLGFANLLADGFAMSLGAFLSTKSRKDNYKKYRSQEYWEVENLPELEKEEVRDIFRAKGFEGEMLEKITEVITSDKDRWVEVMMKDELEMIEEKNSAFSIGLVTFISFILIGLIPLSVYVLDFTMDINLDLFLSSSILTGIGFIFIGYLKSHVNKTSALRGILETLLLGTLAAFVAYYVGAFIEGLIN